MKISIVLPIYNEADNINILYQEIKSVFHNRKEDYEIICVDDGSTDDSLKVLHQISGKDIKLKLIAFRFNA